MSNINASSGAVDRGGASSHQSRGAFLWYLLVGVLALNLLVFLVVGSSLYRGQLLYQERAKAATQNMVQLLEHDLASTLDKIDLTLWSVKDEIEKHALLHKGHEGAINDIIASHFTRHPELDSLRVADAHGTILYGIGVQPALRQNMAGRDYFAHLRDYPDAGLVFSEAVIGITSRKWVLVMARRLNAADGSFAGVVYAPIALDHFQRLFASLNLGKQGAVSLRSGDLSLIVRQPEPKQDGQDIGSRKVSTQLRQSIDSNPVGGLYVAHTAIDQVERVNAYQKIGKYPFYIIVGLATGDFLAEWQNDATRAILLTTAILFISLLSSWLIYRNWRRLLTTSEALAEDIVARQVAEEKLRTGEERLRLLTANVSDMISRHDLTGNFLFASAASAALFGYGDGELRGRTVFDFVHPEDLAKVQASLHQTLADVRTVICEYRLRHKDGSYLWVESASKIFCDASGAGVEIDAVTRDVGERKRREDELCAQAWTDALTGIPNRRFFMARLEEELLRAHRFHDQHTAVLMADIDHFKRINDSYGHLAGDAVLRHLTAVMQEALRKIDTVGRIGGEEFAFILPGSDLLAARLFAERLRQKIAEQACQFDGQVIPVTISIGIAGIDPRDAAIDAVLARADAALYLAKENGRNRVEIQDVGDSPT